MSKIAIENLDQKVGLTIQSNGEGPLITPLTPLRKSFTTMINLTLERTVFTQQEVMDMCIEGLQVISSAEDTLLVWAKNVFGKNTDPQD